MADGQRLLARPGARSTAALTLGAGIAAVGIGVAIGNPSPGGFLLIAVVLAVALVALILAKPFVGFLSIATSAVFLIVVAVTNDRYLNVLDLTLPALVLVALFGQAAREARKQDAALAGEAHDEIRIATHRFARATIYYFALTGASLIPMAIRIGPQEALTSFLVLARDVEAALIFPLGLWLLRTEERIRQTFHAALVGGALFTLVNLYQAIFMNNSRAGATWVTNHLDWFTEGPNEAGVGMVLLAALILAFHAVRPRARNYSMLGLAMLMLFLTLSRSGILAMLTFLAFSLRKIRVRYLLGALGILGVSLALVPWNFWARMARSVSFTRGSIEVYTIMIRVYGYITSWKIFMDNWLFGLGFLAGRSVSQQYNDLQIGNLGSENFYLETAMGTGVIGLAVLALWFVRLYQLGNAVRRSTRPGTLGHQMAHLHAPLMTALAVANLTASNFVGLTPLAQVALWCVLLVRAGHLSADDSAPAGREAAA